MAMKGILPLVIGLAIASAGAVRASAASTGTVAAIHAAVVRDMTIAVAPWIPCTQGRARALSLQTVRAQQGSVGSC